MNFVGTIGNRCEYHGLSGHRNAGSELMVIPVAVLVPVGTEKGGGTCAPALRVLSMLSGSSIETTIRIGKREGLQSCACAVTHQPMSSDSAHNFVGAFGLSMDFEQKNRVRSDQFAA